MDNKFQIEPLFYVVAAAAVLLIPLRWLAAWTVAAAFHELWHILALKVTGIPVRQITIGPNGTEIHTQSMSLYRELLCAAAGPVGSFSLLLLARWMPLVAVCGFIQGAYNLLPLNTMDGGRVVSCLLTLWRGEAAAIAVQNIIEWSVITCLLALSLYCLLGLSLGPLSLIFVLFLAVRSGKIPCKSGCKRVQ